MAGCLFQYIEYRLSHANSIGIFHICAPKQINIDELNVVTAVDILTGDIQIDENINSFTSTRSEDIDDVKIVDACTVLKLPTFPSIVDVRIVLASSVLASSVDTFIVLKLPICPLIVDVTILLA